MADLNRDANNAYSNYVNNVAQSNANIDIQRYQNLLEQYRIDQEKASKETKEALEREIATIAQYDADYTAEIQKREALNPNDPLIPYLKVARQQKLDALEKGLQEQMKAEQEAQKERVKQAMDLWETLGYATQEVADTLNIPVGTKTGDYAYKQANLAKKNSSGSPKENDNTPIYKSTMQSIANHINNNLGKNIIEYDNDLKSYDLVGELEENENLTLNNQQVFNWYKDPIIQDVLIGVNDNSITPKEAQEFLLNLGYTMADIERVKNYTFVKKEGE
jgi:hypothetical protein